LRVFRGIFERLLKIQIIFPGLEHDAGTQEKLFESSDVLQKFPYKPSEKKVQKAANFMNFFPKIT
jgi:hypothetical protein